MIRAKYLPLSTRATKLNVITENKISGSYPLLEIKKPSPKHIEVTRLIDLFLNNAVNKQMNSPKINPTLKPAILKLDNPSPKINKTTPPKNNSSVLKCSLFLRIATASKNINITTNATKDINIEIIEKTIVFKSKKAQAINGSKTNG